MEGAEESSLRPKYRSTFLVCEGGRVDRNLIQHGHEVGNLIFTRLMTFIVENHGERSRDEFFPVMQRLNEGLASDLILRSPRSPAYIRRLIRVLACVTYTTIRKIRRSGWSVQRVLSR